MFDVIKSVCEEWVGCVCVVYTGHKVIVPVLYSDPSFSEVNSGFFYKTAAEREKLVAAERKFIDDRVQKVIDLKKQVCVGVSHEGVCVCVCVRV